MSKKPWEHDSLRMTKKVKSILTYNIAEAMMNYKDDPAYLSLPETVSGSKLVAGTRYRFTKEISRKYEEIKSFVERMTEMNTTAEVSAKYPHLTGIVEQTILDVANNKKRAMPSFLSAGSRRPEYKPQSAPEFGSYVPPKVPVAKQEPAVSASDAVRNRLISDLVREINSSAK